MSEIENSCCSKIIAVDDSPDNLFLIETVLDNPEYDITLIDSGQEMLDRLPQEGTPDLILLDIMMPDIDGFEVMQRIRQDPSLPYIPIMMITAHDHTNLVEGLNAGADDFVRKPFDIEELQARVRSLLRLKHALAA